MGAKETETVLGNSYLKSKACFTCSFFFLKKKTMISHLTSYLFVLLGVSQDWLVPSKQKYNLTTGCCLLM